MYLSCPYGQENVLFFLKKGKIFLRVDDEWGRKDCLPDAEDTDTETDGSGTYVQSTSSFKSGRRLSSRLPGNREGRPDAQTALGNG